jgi:hypothetical protein
MNAHPVNIAEGVMLEAVHMPREQPLHGIRFDLASARFSRIGGAPYVPWRVKPAHDGGSKAVTGEGWCPAEREQQFHGSPDAEPNKTQANGQWADVNNRQVVGRNEGST